MAKLTADQSGRLAEIVAEEKLSRPVLGRFQRPLFRATRLGEKYPSCDFLVDLLDAKDGSLGFFFVQVKGTSVAVSRSERLPLNVDKERFNRLVRIPAPTYLIGVDLSAMAAFIVAARTPRKRQVSSIAKAYPLQKDWVKIELFKEVLAFWQANRRLLLETRFKDV